MIHGGIDIISRFIFESTAAAIKIEEIRKTGVDGIIGGHCGLPFSQAINEQLWHNAGAIGMPANDGTPRVWFSLLRAEADGVAIEHRALDYDYATAAAKMRRAGLTEEYATSLETGLWPSCDVLPLKEIHERGAVLEPGSAFWLRPLRLDGASGRKRTSVCIQLWPRSNRDTVRGEPGDHAQARRRGRSLGDWFEGRVGLRIDASGPRRNRTVHDPRVTSTPKHRGVAKPLLPWLENA